MEWNSRIKWWVFTFYTMRDQSKKRQKKSLARVEDLMCYGSTSSVLRSQKRVLVSLIVSTDHLHYNSCVAVISLLGRADDQFSFSLSLSIDFRFCFFFKDWFFFHLSIIIPWVLISWKTKDPNNIGQNQAWVEWYLFCTLENLTGSLLKQTININFKINKYRKIKFKKIKKI